MEYTSAVTLSSKVAPGVSYTLARMSFGRRIELLRRIRELGKRIEFLEAGGDLKEKIEATLLTHEVDSLYLEWGLRGVTGLFLNGQEATPETLLAEGPENLCREVIDAIKAECGLTEEERKN